jgi:two-component system cell cycle sensor histidine kinase/response regulator CckA
MRILLAEDHDGVRFVFTEILRRRGFHVTAVHNGREAIKAWSNGETPYDLVLLDIIMPEVDGYETYCELSRRHPKARFLFVSGFTDRDIAERIRREGETCLEKPFPCQELVEAVHDILASQEADA